MRDFLLSLSWTEWLAMGIPALVIYAMIMRRLTGVATVGDCICGSVLVVFGPIATAIIVMVVLPILTLTWKEWWLVKGLLRVPILRKHQSRR
jgi:hypothetical protein